MCRSEFCKCEKNEQVKTNALPVLLYSKHYFGRRNIEYCSAAEDYENEKQIEKTTAECQMTHGRTYIIYVRFTQWVH